MAFDKMISQLEASEKELAQRLRKRIKSNILTDLNEEISKMPVSENHELAADWLNGRRTPDANQLFKGGFQNITLGTTTPGIYKGLVEVTCFGSRMIIKRFIQEGIPVKGLIGVGGVAKKSPVVNQMKADITGMPIKIHKSEETCALGAAMFAATVAGIDDNVGLVMRKMGNGFAEEYTPDMEKHKIYNIRYNKYKNLCQFIENAS